MLSLLCSCNHSFYLTSFSEVPFIPEVDFESSDLSIMIKTIPMPYTRSSY